MRKILLGTTAVVGAALLGAQAHAQEAPTVRVGGYFDFSAGYINDSADRNRITATSGTRSRDKIDFRSDAEIHIFVSGKAANGLEYGAVVELQVDNFGGSAAGTGVDTDEMYMFLASPTLGRLIVGDEDSATNLLQVRPLPPFAAGVAGRWTDYVQHSSGSRYLMGSINDGNDATKIIYLSPQFFGFDFGISYAPNAGEGERELIGASGAVPGAGPYVPGATAMQRDGSTLRDEIGAAIRYRGSFGNVGVAAGFGAQTAKPPVTAPMNTPNVTAYNIGLTVSAFGVSVGGEYVWGKYAGPSPGRAPVLPGRGNSNHYVLGASYTFAPFAVGGFYGRGAQDNGPGVSDLTQTVWGLGAIYNIAPGLQGFVNYTNVSDKNRAAIGNPARTTRSIDAFIVGMALAF
jgi:predicted porin